MGKDGQITHCRYSGMRQKLCFRKLKLSLVFWAVQPDCQQMAAVVLGFCVFVLLLWAVWICFSRFWGRGCCTNL